MSVEKWNSSYKLEEKQEVKQNIFDTISLWGAIGVLWCAFFSIIGEHFPEFMSADWKIIIPYLVVLWLAHDCPKNYLKKWMLPSQTIGMLIPVAYIVWNLEKVLDGFVRVAELYLVEFNSYYDSNYYLGVANQNENAVYAMTALAMFLWSLSWTLAYGWQKRVILLVFPVLALTLELVVGLSPKGNGLLYMFWGAMFLLAMSNASIIKRFIAIACAVVMVFLSGAIYAEELYEPIIRKNKQAILKWQNSVNLENINLANLFQFDFHYNWEKLNNGAPRYSGKTMLEIETDIKPVGTVYLKGFYGTNYENGDWIYDDTVFLQACKEAGKNPEEVAKQLFQMPYERIREQYSNHPNEIKYQIFYVGATGNVAYVPYATDYSSLDDAYTLVGDYLFKKSVFDSITTGSALNEGFRYIENEAAYQNEELDFLNRLSQAYMQLPEERDFIAKAVEKIKESTPSNVESGNRQRMQYAEDVEKYLESQMSYSLKLDALPADMDPIEYALTVSHEGYCMHFASAATLILRELGVPARYVSGYAVEPTAFRKDTETGTFKAEVGDYMSHAWVEIYLENYGWIVVDATPGGSLDKLPTQGDINQWENISEAERDKYDPPEKETQTEETEDSETQTEESSETELTPTESEETQDTQETTQSESEEKPTENPGGGGTGENRGDYEGLLKAFGAISAVVVMILLLAFAVRYGAKRYTGLLLDEMENNMTKEAVKRIHRRMYYRIRMQNPKLWFVRKMTDKEFEKTLIDKYPEISAEEWEKYMKIVQKNHYSEEHVSTEDMKYCYNLYVK